MTSPSKWLGSFRRAITIGGTAMAAVLAFAVPAAAHHPILLDDSDVNPTVAPLATDGTDPLGFFATLPKPGAVRSFQLDLKAGDPLSIGLFVPDKAPENTLSTAELPSAYVVAPDGTYMILAPVMRIPFVDEDSGNNYLLLNMYSGTAIAGTYSIIVTGKAVERAAVATGVESEEFHGIQRGNVATEDQITHWYNTAP